MYLLIFMLGYGENWVFWCVFLIFYLKLEYKICELYFFSKIFNIWLMIILCICEWGLC